MIGNAAGKTVEITAHPAADGGITQAGRRCAGLP